ncbi:hypothetical protein D3C76_832360 [compost metagenome]
MDQKLTGFSIEHTNAYGGQFQHCPVERLPFEKLKRLFLRRKKHSPLDIPHRYVDEDNRRNEKAQPEQECVFNLPENIQIACVINHPALTPTEFFFQGDFENRRTKAGKTFCLSFQRIQKYVVHGFTFRCTANELAVRIEKQIMDGQLRNRVDFVRNGFLHLFIRHFQTKPDRRHEVGRNGLEDV